MGENAIFAGMSQFDVEHEYLGIDITADPPRLLAPFCAIINILLLLSSVDRADYLQKFTLHFSEIFRFHKKTRSSDIVKYPLVKCRGYFSETIFIFVSRACTTVYSANTTANHTSTKILLYYTILA